MKTLIAVFVFAFVVVANAQTNPGPACNPFPCISISSGTFLGTSGSLGGGALIAGACATTTVTVTGATTSMVVVLSPATYPGDGFEWASYVSAVNTVTAKVCALIAGTPTASLYNVRVIQ